MYEPTPEEIAAEVGPMLDFLAAKTPDTELASIFDLADQGVAQIASMAPLALAMLEHLRLRYFTPQGERIVPNVFLNQEHAIRSGIKGMPDTVALETLDGYAEGAKAVLDACNKVAAEIEAREDDTLPTTDGVTINTPPVLVPKPGKGIPLAQRTA